MAEEFILSPQQCSTTLSSISRDETTIKEDGSDRKRAKIVDRGSLVEFKSNRKNIKLGRSNLF